MGERDRKISKFTGRWITEQGAGTVEYVIVVLVAIVIGGGLLGFGNQVSGQVTKTTDNQGGGSVGTPSATTDKVFLLSASEVYGNIQSDGTQYEVYKSKGVSTSSYSGASSGLYHWTRSVGPSWSTGFRCVHEDGVAVASGTATSLNNVLPAWCF